MPRKTKPTPKTAFDISHEQINPYLPGRAPIIGDVSDKGRSIVSMKGDKIKDVSIGLEDIDNAIMFYFNNIIKPTVIQDNNRVDVRVIYGNPERWKSIQQDGFLRDGNGHITVPIIVFKRDSIEKSRELGNKLDGNSAALYQVMGEKYNSRNAYDKFSILNNRIPSKQYYLSTVPDYITLKYDCIIFTNFVEQNNKIVESIEFASDSYWGDPSRFKFRTSIDSFSTSTIIENEGDRVAKSTFSIKVNGYIVPDSINKDLATIRSKFYTKSQIVFDLEVIDSAGQVTNVDELKFANKISPANSSGGTSFIGGGTIVNNYSTGGSSLDLIYINTQKRLQADTITADTATFTGALILEPPAGSTLPATSVDNFVFYINGQYVSSSLISITSVIGGVTFTFTGLDYILESDDEIIAIGKFQ